jgi:hypothetical protein
MGIKKIVVAAAAAAVTVAVAAPAPARAAGPAMHVYVTVDGADTGDCPQSAPCASLSYALTRVADGGEIAMGVGSYHTNATVPTHLTVTIRGAGGVASVLDGELDGPVLVAYYATVTLQNLFIWHGQSASQGGAVSTVGGSLKLIRSQVVNNESGDLGGGIGSVDGDVSLVDSVVSVNRASRGGGGIFVMFGSLTATGSTIHGNRVTSPGKGTGAGVLVIGESTLTVRDSTVSQNAISSGGRGGAIALERNVVARLSHVTIASNRAAAGAGLSFTDQDDLTLDASVFSGNTGSNCYVPPDPEPVLGSYTVDSDGSCPALPGNITGSTANLEPLDARGGPTPTHTYPSSSVAHDAIPADSTLCDGNDQRGRPRRYGNSTACDAGAIQLPTPAALVASDKAVQFGAVGDGGTATAAVTLTNNGGTPLRVTGVTIAGTGFRVSNDGCATRTLVPAERCKLTLEFHPLAAPYRGTLSITGATPDGGLSAVVALLGNGIGAPVPHTQPTVTGTPTKGATLNATPGGWGGAAPMRYTYQWLRCEPTGGKCTPIADATAATYALTGRDIGCLLAVSVTANNAAGDGGPLIGYATAPTN